MAMVRADDLGVPIARHQYRLGIVASSMALVLRARTRLQRVPELLRTLKLAVDRKRKAGRFVLTGSANHPWRHTALVGAPQPLLAVSCTSLSRCVVVGESISEHLSGT